MAKKSQKFDAKAALVGAVLAALLTSLFWYATVNNQASLFNFGGTKLQPVQQMDMQPVMQDSFSGDDPVGF